MRSKRSNAPPETARDRGFACRVGESGAAPEPARPHRPRPDAERYFHTVRDPMVPMGDIEVGIGTSSMSSQLPKRSIFAPRGAFGCACGCAMFTGGRIRYPRSDAERHPHALPAHHARSARPPLGIGGVRSHRWGRGSKRVEVHCKTRSLLVHPCNYGAVVHPA